MDKNLNVDKDFKIEIFERELLRRNIKHKEKVQRGTTDKDYI